jgi:Ser/Thr protein kinase RdoA (MazF antagonist)
LALACGDVGLDAGDARLVRLGENAIFLLPPVNVVARIARSIDLSDRVGRELSMARWLAALDFPAVRVAEDVKQLIEADGRLVTFWVLVPESSYEATFEDLGVMLRRLHALPTPPFDLPVFDPFSVVPMRLANPGEADSSSVAYLMELYEELRDAYARLEFPTPFGLIHGDAHRGNLLMDGRTPLLTDFEVVACGPREWDLTPTALSVDRFGLPRDTYKAFADAYGSDVIDWSGFAVLRAIRELTMTTWLMQIVGEGQRYADEFALRVDSLRKGDRERRWHVV